MPLVPISRMSSLFAGQQLGEVAEGVADALAHPPVGGEPFLGGGEVAALALGQRYDAPGRAPPAFDPRLAAVGVDQHQLGRAAANVEDQGRAVARLEQAVAAEHRQPRFLLGRDDLEADAGLAPHPLDELAAVDRAAAGLGGDRAGEADAAAAAASRRRRRARRPRGPSRFADLAAGRHALAEPDDAREGVDDGEAVLAGPGDQQPAIVGAEIDRAIAVARRRALARREALEGRFGRFRSRRLRSHGGLLRHRPVLLILFSFQAAEIAR